MFSLLIVEDDADMASLLASLARGQGLEPTCVHDGDAALRQLRAGGWEALLLDLRLPGTDGYALLQEARATEPDLPVVIISGYATVDGVIEVFRHGALDMLTKPFETPEAEAALGRIAERLRHRQRYAALQARLTEADPQPHTNPVAHSPAMAEALGQLERVAGVDIPVLLLGETGTGKGVVARWLHDHRSRREGPFFTLSCGSLAPTLLESELFGHEKGAFTGATERKHGLLELAHGGTLLLDEINSVSSEVQVRLLQFLQERTLMRVGGKQTLSVETRLIVAANEPLEPLVQSGAMRSDFYYRIHVFPVTLPPLRERAEDLLPLAEAFLARFSRKLDKALNGFSDDARAALVAYSWPGNVRELENIIQRATILADGPIVEAAHLPAEIRRKRSPECPPLTDVSPDATLEEVKHAWMQHMLERCGGNKTEAARRLGVDPSTLHRLFGPAKS